jgi:glycine/D-amino acid oxidase-like deaminating enzyme
VRDQADVVAAGAGIMGFSSADHLASRGMMNVTVVDRGYLCGGARGRNGGGVRAPWSTEADVRLMQESLRMCRAFATKMKINVWFRQGGDLFLARTPAIRDRLEKSAAPQNACGLAIRMLTPARSGASCQISLPTAWTPPAIAPTTGGVPWPFLWGYARAARKLGVEVFSFHEVTGFETHGPHARSRVRTCPVLGRVKELRQWTGCYDLTPHANPMVGTVAEVEHFCQASGFMGHGLMMAPIIGKLIAELVNDGTIAPLLERWNIRRFAGGKLLPRR